MNLVMAGNKLHSKFSVTATFKLEARFRNALAQGVSRGGRVSSLSRIDIIERTLLVICGPCDPVKCRKRYFARKGANKNVSITPPKA